MISVIVPLFNDQNKITQALESVRNQVCQEQFEIIIVNDGSTDQSRSIVENYILENRDLNIRLINQENRGVSGARNTGLREATGDYIALLDSDDIWLREKTAKQMAILKNDSLKVDLLGSLRNGIHVLFPYRVNKNNLVKVSFQKLLIRNELLPPSVIFKRKVLENTGYFEETQRYAEDVDYWLRATLHNQLYVLNESLIIAGNGKRSFGVSGLSGNLKEMKKGYQQNLLRLLQSERISVLSYQFLKIFYYLKHCLLVTRSWYYSRKGK